MAKTCPSLQKWFNLCSQWYTPLHVMRWRVQRLNHFWKWWVSVCQCKFLPIWKHPVWTLGFHHETWVRLFFPLKFHDEWKRSSLCIERKFSFKLSYKNVQIKNFSQMTAAEHVQFFSYSSKKLVRSKHTHTTKTTRTLQIVSFTCQWEIPKQGEVRLFLSFSTKTRNTLSQTARDAQLPQMPTFGLSGTPSSTPPRGRGRGRSSGVNKPGAPNNRVRVTSKKPTSAWGNADVRLSLSLFSKTHPQNPFEFNFRFAFVRKILPILENKLHHDEDPPK